MNIRALFLGLFVVSNTVMGATRPPWPKTVRVLSKSEFKPVTAARLPEGILLFHHEGGTAEARAERVVNIARVDLNNDGIPELLVEHDEGANGGVYYTFYRRRHGKYAEIGSGQTWSITLLSRFHGYYQLGLRSSGGGGDTVRELYRYEHGGYRCVRFDEFHWEKYVGTHKPEE